MPSQAAGAEGAWAALRRFVWDSSKISMLISIKGD
jgi:hypothetical protein